MYWGQLCLGMVDAKDESKIVEVAQVPLQLDRLEMLGSIDKSA